MSITVADELAKIKSFSDSTEKRKSTLTLNELNYISDKQLHKTGGGSMKGCKVRFVLKDTTSGGVE